MLGMYFTDQRASEIRSYDQVARCDAEKFKRFFHALLARGIYLAPSAFEATFVSAAHSNSVIDTTLAAITDALIEIQGASA